MSSSRLYQPERLARKVRSYPSLKRSAVATAFVGVWGMNFEAMPELKWRWGYPLAMAVIVAVCGLMYRRFRKAGWL